MDVDRKTCRNAVKVPVLLLKSCLVVDNEADACACMGACTLLIELAGCC